MSKVKKVEAFVLTVPRDEPYLGGQHNDEGANERGYFVRQRNRTVYPIMDRSVVVRLETESGVIGWGETYGLVAPRAVLALINDFMCDFVVGRDAFDAAVIHEDLYNMMRFRGYGGGYYMDALAAIDIALWDAAGRCANLPVAKLLGGRRRDRIPAYVSGLPKPTLTERAEFAAEWQGKGFNSFKFAAPMAEKSLAAEISGLREVLGSEARIAADMHWTCTSAEAVSQIKEMEPHGLWFAEAPVATEDVAGLADVARGVQTPIGVGEEWRTVYDAQARINARAVHIIQPEMGHTGITEFMRMGLAAQAAHLRIIPHATIGSGIFLAASLQASSALECVEAHEFQHSIFCRNTGLITEGIECKNGEYILADKPGIGVEPTEEMISKLER
ncbi:MAG: mandelate racemase/muconate lactonizing enzyme family protein [Opitutaceae bacterium]